MYFGEKFKPLLDGVDISYRELMTILGYTSPGSITNLTQRKTLPPQDKLDRICDFFGVPVSYFTDKDSALKLHRTETEYISEKQKIPLMESEAADAKVKEILVVPHLGVTQAFAIEVADDRLTGIGIPCGSTVLLSKKFKLSSKHKVIVQMGDRRFFATYEKRKDDAVIIPADSKMPLIVLDKANKSEVTIYAVATNIITKL